MHKYTGQTAKDPLSRADTSLMAEDVVDHLREARGAESQLSPAQERAERMAALARNVRENRAKSQRPDTESKSPEAVKEALDQIKARRAKEQARRDETRRTTDDPTPRQHRGPGIGR